MPAGQAKKICGNVLCLQTHDHLKFYVISKDSTGGFLIQSAFQVSALGQQEVPKARRPCQKWVINDGINQAHGKSHIRAVVVWVQPFYNMRWTYNTMDTMVHGGER